MEKTKKDVKKIRRYEGKGYLNVWAKNNCRVFLKKS
jgi:hypothetical protein